MNKNADWNKKRWNGILRPYTPADVKRLKGNIEIKYTLAEMGSRRLWDLLSGSENDKYIHSLSAITGNQAIQHVQAGLKAIYVSGWQVAADMNEYGSMYPDQSIYPANSVPVLIKRLSNALKRADEIECLTGKTDRYWFAPLIADAEAGFGGTLNAFEIMKAMIEAGAAGVHFEDQLSSEKKCGHLGGKVLVPTQEFKKKLIAARLAADICDVPSIIIARTDAHSAKLITSDCDPYDVPYITGARTADGFYPIKDGVSAAISRCLAYSEYADLLWWETSTPDLGEAKEVAQAIHEKYPEKLLAYNCSPSFNWKRNIPDATEREKFQEKLAEMGYKYQFVTLSAFHSINHAMFNLALNYKKTGMGAYSDLQEKEFELEPEGYKATKHQKFVGTGYFDAVTEVINQGKSATTAMSGSTEEDQF